jgi:hypothetical protein
MKHTSKLVGLERELGRYLWIARNVQRPEGFSWRDKDGPPVIGQRAHRHADHEVLTEVNIPGSAGEWEPEPRNGRTGPGDET